MCLHDVKIKEHNIPKEKALIGYKVFRLDKHGRLLGMMSGISTGNMGYTRYKRKGVNKAKRWNIFYSGVNKSYKSGYHIWVSEQVASKYAQRLYFNYHQLHAIVVHKVKYWGKVTKGEHLIGSYERTYTRRCDVAEHMEILEEVHRREV